MSSHPIPATLPRPAYAPSVSRTLATAARVLRQLRHDPRSIALMLLV
ncbi:ABC transporter permease, partial [Streptomyces sp. NPDC015232]